MASSPGDSWGKLRETRRRLELCCNEELDWSPFPQTLKEVANLHIHVIANRSILCLKLYLNL